MDRCDFDHCRKVAVEAARAGAKEIERWSDRFHVREKGRADLVTEADLAAQEAIRQFLETRFPAHAFLGEEAEPRQIQHRLANEADRPLWIVDPLDGTTNYVHGLPVFAVSIGLHWAGKMVVGVVFDPNRGEMYEAFAGGGAWLNGVRLRVSSADRLDQALLSAGFPPQRDYMEQSLAIWSHLSLQAQSLRRTGCTSLNLAYVAAGRHDGFWAVRIHPWDVAGGIVLIEEAGGCVTRLDGSPYAIDRPDCLASNGRLHDALVAAVQQAVAKPC